MSGGSFPTLKIEGAFTTNPYDPAPNYEDLTNDLDGSRQLAIRRTGRQRALDHFEAGTAMVPLENLSRQYDPTNSSGPHAPNVLPGNRGRISATFNSVLYRLFTGFADGWTPKWRLDWNQSDMALTDALGLLAQEGLQSPYFMEVIADAPTCWYRLNEPSGATIALDSSGNGLSGAYHGSPGLGGASQIADTAAKSASLDGANSWVSLPAGVGGVFTVTGWVTQPPSGGIADLFDQGNAAAGAGLQIICWGMFQVIVNGLTINAGSQPATAVHFAVTRDPSNLVTLYVNGVAVASATIAGTISPAPVLVQQTAYGWQFAPSPGAFQDVAIWNGTALSAARIAAHFAAGTGRAGESTGARFGWLLDKIGWAAGERAIDAGAATLAPASDLATDTGGSHLQALGDTEGGSFYVRADGKLRLRQRFTLPNTSQATLTDQVGLNYINVTPAYDRIPLKNQAQVSRRGGAIAFAHHAGSRTKYRTSLATLEIRADRDQAAVDTANWIVSTWKDPVLQIRQIEIEPLMDDNLWPQVLGREIEDVITLVATPTGGGAPINQLMVIQGIEHDIGPGVAWKTRWWLAPLAQYVCMAWSDPLMGFWNTTPSGIPPRWGY